MPNYKLAAARAAKKYGINQKVFLNMIQAESGFRPGVASGAGARGIAQFIPSTAKAYGVNLDDGLVTDDLEGAARYLRDNLKRTKGNYAQALSIYNSGSPTGYLRIPETINYVNKILKGGNISVTGDVGKTPGKKGKPGKVEVVTTGKTTIPGKKSTKVTVDDSAVESALIEGLLSGRKDLLQIAASIEPTTTVERTQEPDKEVPVKDLKVTPGTPGSSSSSGPTGKRGKVTIAGGADRSGVSTQKPILNFLRQIAGASGREVVVTTGTNHSQMTTSGNTSDHWAGNAADLGMNGDARQSRAVDRKGTLVAAHAIQEATALQGKRMSFEQAYALAHKGGIHNFDTPKGRIQIIWRTDLGGNHWNHVHVGLNPKR